MMRSEFFTTPEFRAVADAELDAINKWTLKPLSADDVAVFSLELCNNQIDKHHSRFPEDELLKINRMVIGKPLMENHDLTRRLPRGTFFASRIRTAGTKVTVCPDVYILRTRQNEDFIKNIEGGVYRQTSISFNFTSPECSICHRDMQCCDHTPGQKYGDQVCHYIMHDVTDVLEGSVVPAGSQGTVFFGARGLPMCAKSGLDCTGCCSCAKADDPGAETQMLRAQIQVEIADLEADLAETHADPATPFRELGDDFLDNMVYQKPTRVMAAGYCVRYFVENPHLAIHDGSTNAHTVTEVYKPGCFRDFLTTNKEIECRLNHGRVVLGRRSDGSFRLKETRDGLYVELDLNASTEFWALEAVGWSINRIDKDASIDSGPYDPLAETIYSAGIFEEISLIAGAGHEPALRTSFEVKSVDPDHQLRKRRVAVAHFHGIQTRKSRTDEVKMLLAEA